MQTRAAARATATTVTAAELRRCGSVTEYVALLCGRLGDTRPVELVVKPGKGRALEVHGVAGDAFTVNLLALPLLPC